MDETNKDTSAANETLRRNACRLAATEALLPLTGCRNRRCRRSRKCLGRFAPMLAADGRRSSELPRCLATASRDGLLRYCRSLDAARRALLGTPGNPTCLLEVDRPDDRPWPWPPLPIAALAPPRHDVPQRRCGHLRPRPPRTGP